MPCLDAVLARDLIGALLLSDVVRAAAATEAH
jgi:hypothetical protein